MDQSDQNAVDVVAEQELAANLDSHWRNLCRQIALVILPSFAPQFQTSPGSSQTPTQTNTNEMVDTNGALALKRFAAAMESMNTPHNTQWHGLIPSDPTLRQHRDVRLWFEELTRLVFKLRYASTANFASQKYCDYLMLGAFGDAILYTDALQNNREKGLRYRSIHPGQCSFRENHQGLIDTNYRRFSLTADQAVSQFGLAQVPEVIAKQASESKRKFTMHEFIHKVAPRGDYDPGRKDMKGLAFASCYVSLTGRKTVRESGYSLFPYAISRYFTTPGDVRGHSPARMALPTLKSLNEMKKSVIKQGHRATDPILLAHDDGIVDDFSWRPGSITSGGVSDDGKPLVHALPVGNLAAGDKLMDAEKSVIHDFFLVSLFQILVETPEMTATQVVERAREKAQLLTPEMRQQAESLGPMIDREIDVLRELRLIPPMPQILIEAQGEYTIQYDSPLSRMARAEESSGFMHLNDYWLNYSSVTGDHGPLDHFNYDVAIPEMADSQAVPTRWRNGMSTIQKIRDDRAKQAQQQQMVDAAPAGASVLKQLLPQQQPAGTA